MVYKDRNLRELLELLLLHKEYFFDGLCSWNSKLYNNGIITYQEWYTLQKYIDKNRPKWHQDFDAFKHNITSPRRSYYWKVYDINPRIKWIKKHIKLN